MIPRPLQSRRYRICHCTHDSGNIVCANALRYDWNEILPGGECDYVMGNPPFIGHVARKTNPTLSEDMEIKFPA